MDLVTRQSLVLQKVAFYLGQAMILIHTRSSQPTKDLQDTILASFQSLQLLAVLVDLVLQPQQQIVPFMLSHQM